MGTREEPDSITFYEEQEPVVWVKADPFFFHPIQIIHLSNLESPKNKVTIYVGFIVGFWWCGKTIKPSVDFSVTLALIDFLHV
jgi:hypothetical protein